MAKITPIRPGTGNGSANKRTPYRPKYEGGTSTKLTYFNKALGEEVTIDFSSGKTVRTTALPQRTTDPIYRQQGADESDAAYKRALNAASERSANQAELLRRQTERTEDIRRNPNQYINNLIDQYDRTMASLEKGNMDSDYAARAFGSIDKSSRDLEAQMRLAGYDMTDVEPTFSALSGNSQALEGYYNREAMREGNQLDLNAGQMQFLNTLTEEEKLEYFQQHDPARAEAMLENMEQRSKNWAEIYRQQLEELMPDQATYDRYGGGAAYTNYEQQMKENGSAIRDVQKKLASAEQDLDLLENREWYRAMTQYPDVAVMGAWRRGDQKQTEEAWNYLSATDPSIAKKQAEEIIAEMTAERQQLVERYNADPFSFDDESDHRWAYLDEEITKWNERLHQATYQMEGVRMGDVAKEGSESYDPRFAEFSQYNSIGEYLEPEQMNVAGRIYEYINNDDTAYRMRLAAETDTLTGIPYAADFEKYQLMNDEEIALFNYYYVNDPEQALHYLDTISETLNYRAAVEDYKENWKGKPWKEALLGAWQSGFNQYLAGSESVGHMIAGDNYIPTTKGEYLAGMMREDLSDSTFATGVYDVGSSIANMLPSVLVSSVSPVAGKIVFGASVSGNAYKEAVNKGFDPKAARWYAGAIGAAEVFLQDALGGISKMSGANNLTDKVVNGLLSKVDNAIGRAAIQLGASSMGEATEEYLQEIIGPVLENVILGAHNDINLISEEAIYAGILGAFTALPMNMASPGTEGFIGNIGTAMRENLVATVNKPYASEVVAEAKTYNAGSETLKRVEKQMAKGGTENISNRDLALLVQENAEVAKKDERPTFQPKPKATEEKPSRTIPVNKNGTATTDAGESVAVRGVGYVDGNVLVRVADENGTERNVSRSTLDLSDDVADLVDLAAQYGYAAPAVYAAFDNSMDFDHYADDVEMIMSMAKGSVGVNGTKALNWLKNNQTIKMEPEAIETLFAAGREIGIQEQPLIRRGTGKVTFAEGIDRTKLKGRQKAQVEFLEEFAKLVGVDIEFFESSVENGQYVGENGSYIDNRIRIDLNAGRNYESDSMAKIAITRTASHELTHWLKDIAPKEYMALRSFVVEKMIDEGGGTLQDMIDEQKRRAGGKLSTDDAIDEIVADGCEMMLGKSEYIREYAEKNAKGFETIKNWLKKFLAKLKAAFKGVDSAHRESVVLMEKHLDEMIALWDNALKAGLENPATAPATKAESKAAESDEAKKDAQQKAEHKGEKFSARESDAAYLDAVNRNDMETAQRMVDEAAKGAGYGVTTYHGTDKDFTVFKTLFHNEFGYHTGTKRAAEERTQFVPNGKVHKLYANLGKTIRTPDVFGYFAGMHDYIFYVRGEKSKVSDMDFLKQYGRSKKFGNKFPHNEVLDRLHDAYTEFVESGYKRSKSAAVVELTQEYLKSIGIDSIAYTNAYESAGSTSYLMMNPNQVKSADPVTYDDNGNVIPLSERFNAESNDIRYSVRDPLTEEITRLEQQIKKLEQGKKDAFVAGEMRVARQAGKDIRQREERIAKLEQDLEATKEKYRTSMGEARIKAKQKQENLEAQIKKLKRDSRDDLKEMREKLADLKKQDAQRLKDYRANRNESDAVKKYRRHVEKHIKDLQDMLFTNTDKKHIPEPLKEPIGKFLDSLMPQMYSRSAYEKGETTNKDIKLLNTWDKLESVLRSQINAQNGMDDGKFEFDGYLDLPPEMMSEFEELKKNIGLLAENASIDDPLYQMSSGDLQRLDWILKTIKHSVNQANMMLSATKQSVLEASKSTIEAVNELGETKLPGKIGGTLGKFLTWDNTTPFYAFKRFGEGGKTIFNAIAAGWDKLAFNSKAVIDFSEKTYTDKEVKAWTKETHDFELDSGESIRMTESQMMALYCLSKRPQAMGHLLGGGIRVANIEKGKNKIQQSEPRLLTLDDIEMITGALTAHQRDVADKIQKFMTEQGSAWGNEVSMKRFGYRAFTEEVYFPIMSDQNNFAAIDHEAKANDLFRLLNISATKALTQNANNAITVQDIFDVYAAHMSDMAKYNALALPVLDAFKWINYKEDTKNPDGTRETVTVQRAMEKAYGKQAQQYLITFLKDLNAAQTGGRRDSGIMNIFMSNAKVASVAANVRVALLQPTAYIKAANLVDPKWLAAGAAMTPKQRKASVEEMLANSGIALWKDLGFYDTNIGRSLTEKIKHSESLKDKAVETSMALAELMDRVTWGTLWNACKREVLATQHLHDDALLKATAERFREVVYATQVVDSTLTRSHIMRDKDGLTKMATSFMSEPTIAYNMMMEQYTNFVTTLRKTGSKGQAWQENWKGMARAAGAFSVTALATALVEALTDIAREDEEKYAIWEKAFLKKYIAYAGTNFVSNLNPAGMVPIIRDIVSALEGFAINRQDVEWVTTLIEAFKTLQEFYQVATGKQESATKLTYYGNMTGFGVAYKVLKGVSMMSGLPISALVREFQALWNNSVGLFREDRLLKTYDAGDEEDTKSAYSEGYITADEASRRLVATGKTEDEAYWDVQKLDGYGKTDNLAAAIISETGFDAAYEELNSHGYQRKDINGMVSTLVKTWLQGKPSSSGKAYKGHRVDEKAAVDLLVKYANEDREDAKKKVLKWTMYLKTGWDYTEIEDLLISGEISETKAISLITTYGSKDESEAKMTVQAYLWRNENQAYADLSEQKIDRFVRYCDPAGIDIEEFYEANAAAADMKKDEIVDMILGLGLTAKQEEAMWYALKQSSWKNTDTPWE